MVGYIDGWVACLSGFVNECCWGHEGDDGHNDTAIETDSLAKEKRGGLLFYYGQNRGRWWNQNQKNKGDKEKKGPEIEVQENFSGDIDRGCLDSNIPRVQRDSR